MSIDLPQVCRKFAMPSPYIARLSAILCFSLGLAHFAGAQSLDPVVEKLTPARQKQLTFLHPAYLAFPPQQKILDAKIPLVIYLHGAGGVGSDPTKNTGRARGLIKGIRKFQKGPCLVVAPQCQRTSTKTNLRGTWIPEDLNILLEDLLQTHSEIDTQRIYLTGNSMGGYGCWVWGGHHPEHFAAIAPIVGGIGRNGPKDVTPDLKKWAANLARVPVYAFAGARDPVVPAERSQRMVDAIRKAGGQQAKLKIYPDESHGASRVVFSSPEYFQWMFSQKGPPKASKTTFLVLPHLDTM